jgi:predicted dehydrogenase
MAVESSHAPLKVVQVGLGGFGRNWYATKIRPSPDVEVVGFVDLVPELLEMVRSEYGLPDDLFFSTVDEALRKTDAEALIVTASLPGHVPAASAGIAAGKHVLMEKPFAPSVAEARELTAKAEAAGKILMISQNYRYFPATQRAAEIVASGELGQLGVIHVDFRRDHVTYNEGRTRHYNLVHPLLADMAIHHFDLMRMITGVDAKRVRCTGWNPPWSHYRDPPAAEALVEMENGVLITYRGSWVSPGPITPWAGEWRMEFERGEVYMHSRWDDSADDEVVRVRTVPGTVTVSANEPTGASAAKGADPVEYTERLAEVALTDRAGSLAEFVHCVRTGETPQTVAAANIGSIGLTYAAIASLDTGDWVEVER